MPVTTSSSSATSAAWRNPSIDSAFQSADPRSAATDRGSIPPSWVVKR
jgi:hypothetical protein